MFSNGKKHGKGKEFFCDDQKDMTMGSTMDIKYDGEFLNGFKHGYGELNFVSGNQYKGFFEKG